MITPFLLHNQTCANATFLLHNQMCDDTTFQLHNGTQEAVKEEEKEVSALCYSCVSDSQWS